MPLPVAVTVDSGRRHDYTSTSKVEHRAFKFKLVLLVPPLGTEVLLEPVGGLVGEVERHLRQ
jgi:hypothetical protein